MGYRRGARIGVRLCGPCRALARLSVRGSFSTSVVVEFKDLAKFGNGLGLLLWVVRVHHVRDVGSDVVLDDELI